MVEEVNKKNLPKWVYVVLGLLLLGDLLYILIHYLIIKFSLGYKIIIYRSDIFGLMLGISHILILLLGVICLLFSFGILQRNKKSDWAVILSFIILIFDIIYFIMLWFVGSAGFTFLGISGYLLWIPVTIVVLLIALILLIIGIIKSKRKLGVE
ncbi:MAG: hypothetical protein Q7S74_02270 [Nanoarchaeota archaeon]|nr:hypothetical protein [Nanoarchaeota archaeon]